MPGASINRKPLTEQIAEELATRIREGALPPGEELPSEAELARSYEVSRPVIREALRRLEARGYLLIANGRRARVKEAGADLLSLFLQRVLSKDLESWREVTDVREALETLAVREAATRLGEAEKRELRRLLEELERTLEDPRSFSDADVAFHLALARMSGNRLLSYFIEETRAAFTSIMRHTRRVVPEEQLPEVHRSHQGIVEALISEDPAAAEAAMREHFEVVRTQLRMQEE
ncbi:MAG: FadR/GntR family transcriptional regulator [Alkalispirochaetaceae bacterium]